MQSWIPLKIQLPNDGLLAWNSTETRLFKEEQFTEKQAKLHLLLSNLILVANKWRQNVKQLCLRPESSCEHSFFTNFLKRNLALSNKACNVVSPKKEIKVRWTEINHIENGLQAGHRRGRNSVRIHSSVIRSISSVPPLLFGRYFLNLKVLALEFNYSEVELWDITKTMTQLRILSIKKSKIDPKGCEGIALNLIYLNSLELRNTNATDQWLEPIFKQRASLKALKIQQNPSLTEETIRNLIHSRMRLNLLQMMIRVDSHAEITKALTENGFKYVAYHNSNYSISV